MLAFIRLLLRMCHLMFPQLVGQTKASPANRTFMRLFARVDQLMFTYKGWFCKHLTAELAVMLPSMKFVVVSSFV